MLFRWDTRGDLSTTVAKKKVMALKERLYGGQTDGTTMFRRMITDRVGRGGYVLDLGCGRGKASGDFRGEAAFCVGCDVSEDVAKNPFISAGVRGDIYELPFRDGSVDIIFMDFVIEHLKWRDRWADEVFRVLKPGGSLAFRTPNLYHYACLIAWLTPHWFHRLVANRVRRLEREDTLQVCRTYYRANTRRSIERLLKRAGFVAEEVRMVEREPSYLMFCRPAFMAGYLYERFVNRYEALRDLRSNIFGAMKKPRE